MTPRAAPREGFLPPLLAVPAVLGLALLVIPLTALVGRLKMTTAFSIVNTVLLKWKRLRH